MLIVTLLLTLLIFSGVLLVLVWARTPRYRLSRKNVVALLYLLLDGKATEHDWRLFTALPLRHDTFLEKIREQCLDIEEREYTGAKKAGYLFSRQGLLELQHVLDELERQPLEP